MLQTHLVFDDRCWRLTGAARHFKIALVLACVSTSQSGPANTGTAGKIGWGRSKFFLSSLRGCHTGKSKEKVYDTVFHDLVDRDCGTYTTIAKVLMHLGENTCWLSMKWEMVQLSWSMFRSTTT